MACRKPDESHEKLGSGEVGGKEPGFEERLPSGRRGEIGKERFKEVWPGGDHSVILGEVHACEGRPGAPLLFFRSDLEGMAT